MTPDYCTECSWSISIEDHDRDELFQAAIEHFDETGHTIESNVANRIQRDTADFAFSYKERILQ